MTCYGNEFHADLLGYRLANKLFLKVADLAAIEEDYYKSIENYEKVAKASINSNLMKWSVKEYFLKAGICHLATRVRIRSLNKPFLNLHLPLVFESLLLYVLPPSPCLPANPLHRTS